MDNERFLNIIPKDVVDIIYKLEESGYEAHLMGACVRDMLLGRMAPKWDIRTVATPTQIAQIFPDTAEASTGTTLITIKKKFETI